MKKTSDKRDCSGRCPTASALKIFGGVVAVLAVIAVVVFMNLNSVAKTMAEKIGTKTLQTKVSISDMDISLKNQSITVSGVTIKNPEGFKEDTLLKIADIVIAAENLKGDAIIMKEITVNGMEVTYELNENGTNLGKIKSNLKSSSKPAKNEENASSEGPKKDVIIRALNITNAKLIPAIGVGETKLSQPIPLPAIKMTNLGGKSEPLEPAKAITLVLNEIIKTATSTATKAKLSEGMDKVTEGLGDAAGQAGDAISDGVKGLFK